MRNVTRIEAPPLFQAEASKWAKALLNKIKNQGKVSDYYYDRYNQKSKEPIREELEDHLVAMYNNMCCYCEKPTPKSQGQIEHLMPKKKFPRFVYDWENLHWVCHTCNHNKGEKYDDENPILDPTDEESISNHIEEEIDEELKHIWLININSTRGHTTIEHPDLNSEELRKTRCTVYLRTMKLIKQTKRRTVNRQILSMTKEKLKALYEGEFGFVTTIQAAFKDTAFKYEDLSTDPCHEQQAVLA